MLKSISSLATGRRTKFVVVAIWVILGFSLASLQPRLQDATVNENEAFLPESAESTEANSLVEDRFPDGREVDAIIAYERSGGLTGADRERISTEALAIAGLDRPDPTAPCANPDLIDLLAVVDPFLGPICGAGGPEAEPRAAAAASDADAAGPPPVSEDGTVALTLVRAATEESEDIQANVEFLRETVPAPDSGEGELRAYVTGIAGIVSDSIDVFESIDTTLLLVTVSLVLFLLLVIYRSPVIAFVPLFVVAIAYLIAAAAAYALLEAGVFEVNAQTTSLLIVLMFGAGTDYCLLIVSRYREELRKCEDKHAAMARATERTGPAILSAGGTVVAAMLVLAFADFKATQTMGPVLALGVAVMLLAGLTLLPALLSILGRRAFWPAIPKHGTEQAAPLGVWRRIGHLVHQRPMFALGISVAVLLAGSLGNLKDRGVIDFGEGFRDRPESVDGQLLIEERLSGGQTAPTIVLTETGTEQRVSAELSALDGVDVAAPTAVSADGELTRVDVTVAFDPFSDEADALVPELRDAAVAAADGGQVLVGGATAENFDTTQTLRSDARLIVPLVLLLIFLILVALLRAVVAPAYLVLTVVLSYAFAIGASTLIFT